MAALENTAPALFLLHFGFKSKICLLFKLCDIDSLICDTWLIYICVNIMSHVTHESLADLQRCLCVNFTWHDLTYLQVTHDSSIWVYTKYITSRANYCKCCLWVICMCHDSFYTFDVDTLTGNTRLIHMRVYIIHRVTHKSVQTWNTAPESLACDMTFFVHVMFTHLHVTNNSFIWVYT